MQSRFVCLLSLALSAVCSDGLAISQGETTAQKLSVHHKSKKIIDPLLVRPSAGKGPDVVQFGLRAMNFYGTKLKEFTFMIDLVMSLRWNDPRVIALIPEGLDKLSMGLEQALDNVWMPGINVTNRAIENYEPISSSVTIYRTGEIHRVERAMVQVMKKFELQAYPFDSQHFQVNIASSKYMTNEVVLKEDPKGSGVYENIWGLYELEKWGTSVYETKDGPLEKSRGQLDVKVTRGFEKYSQDHLLPSAIVLMISWAVFYFPYANPFITARLCLSILALLQFTNLIVKSCRELPGAAPFNWNDLFNQQIQTLMFLTIILNISSEIANHTFQNERLSKAMNNDAKLLVPGLSILNIVLILGGGMYKWLSLGHATTLTQGLLGLTIVLYVCYAYKQQMKRDAEDAALKSERSNASADDIKA